MSKEKFNGKLQQEFAKPFYLTGDWEMALTSLVICRNYPVFVFCDLVTYSRIDGDEMRLLDYLNPITSRNNSPRYVKIVKKRFACINVDIRKDPLIDEYQSLQDIVCVLHFRKT